MFCYSKHDGTKNKKDKVAIIQLAVETGESSHTKPIKDYAVSTNQLAVAFETLLVLCTDQTIDVRTISEEVN